MKKRTPRTEDLLRAARNLLQTKGWTKGALARTRNGTSVGALNPYAESFCVVGAIYRCQNELKTSDKVRESALDLLQSEIIVNTNYKYTSVDEFNDSSMRTKDDVLNIFNNALRK